MHNCHEIYASAFIYTRERMRIPLHSRPAEQLADFKGNVSFSRVYFLKLYTVLTTGSQDKILTKNFT